jgi:hypothetical protein
MKKLILAAALAAFSTAAFAKMPPYADLDANTDGSVSAEEAKAKMPNMTDEMWKKADADADGKLTAEEYTKMEGK